MTNSHDWLNPTFLVSMYLIAFCIGETDRCGVDTMVPYSSQIRTNTFVASSNPSHNDNVSFTRVAETILLQLAQGEELFTLSR